MGMKSLMSYQEYGFKPVPIKRMEHFTENKNIYLRLEGCSLHKSIKSVTAYYIIKDVLENKRAHNIVESTSGNLGISLGFFAKQVGLNFLCLLDTTVPKNKVKKLENHEIQCKIVNSEGYVDPREARIEVAKKMNQMDDWFWTNQYDNVMNLTAHYEITGPELYKQMNGDVDYVICSIGTGGTVGGVARYMKEMDSNIKIIAVEPYGSTIFGGEALPYLTVGSGLTGLSKNIEQALPYIDYYSKVKDIDSIGECIRLQEKEGFSVGITTGSVLHVARMLSDKYPDKKIACISPDTGEPYKDIIEEYRDQIREHTVEIHLVSDVYNITKG